MKHEQASRLLNAYLDDELKDAERADVARHVAGCTLCAHDLAALRRVCERLQEWPASPRPAGAEGTFWLCLAQRLPARPAERPASQRRQDLWFPLGLAFGNAIVHAMALLAVVFSAVLALDAFAWLESWLVQVLDVSGLSAGDLLRLTGPGWLTMEVLQSLGVAGGELEAWIAAAVGWAGPALFVVAASALMLLSISIWIGARFSRRPAEF